MANRRNVIIAMSLVVLSLVGFAWFLTGQGLDDAEKWVSILGVAVSVCLGGGGVGLAWLTWRNARTGPARPRVSATGTGGFATGGDNDGDVDTEVSGVDPQPDVGPPASGEVSASGTGAAAIGGSNRGQIKIRVTGKDRGGSP